MKTRLKNVVFDVISSIFLYFVDLFALFLNPSMLRRHSETFREFDDVRLCNTYLFLEVVRYVR